MFSVHDILWANFCIKYETSPKVHILICRHQLVPGNICWASHLFCIESLLYLYQKWFGCWACSSLVEQLPSMWEAWVWSQHWQNIRNKHESCFWDHHSVYWSTCLSFLPVPTHGDHMAMQEALESDRLIRVIFFFFKANLAIPVSVRFCIILELSYLYLQISC